MIRIIIACALVSLTAAAAIPDDSQAQITEYHNENDGSGNYDFSFETSNGITRRESGRLINAGSEDQYVDVQGSFTYYDSEGKLVEVNYRADKDGYHVDGQEMEGLVVPAPGSNFRAYIRVIASLLSENNKEKMTIN